MPKPAQLRLLAAATAAVFAGVAVRADIPGNFTLTGDQTFTSVFGDTFVIGGNHSTFNLQNHTATFAGAGNFEINSSIVGTGNVLVNLNAGGSISVAYDANNGNTYSGLTTVRSGTLFLSTENYGNNGVPGDLFIGGGPNPAIVARDEKHNVELIADSATITIAANGTLELNRMDTGNSSVHESLETFRKLVLDGGSIINSSSNTRLTTLNILESVQLLSSSIIDMGVSMTINIGDVDTTAWTPGATLTIKNWSWGEPIYAGDITLQQLSQIQFELPSGLSPAAQIQDGQIVPSALVPEASTFVLVPLLGAAALWPGLRKRFARKQPDPA